ncbi:MAG: hypothetical protein HKL96_00330 [Phycisphaerales bacterium]|nr:hypothetical protein [Phycisphaerales bacterium]
MNSIIQPATQGDTTATQLNQAEMEHPVSAAFSRRGMLKGLAVGGIGMMGLGEAAGTVISPQPPMLFGCFGVMTAQQAHSIHARATRFIFSIYDLPRDIANAHKAIAGQGPMPWKFTMVQALHKAGIKVAITISWGPWKPAKPLPLPTPNSARGKAWLKTTRELVELMGDHLYYLTLDNEPITYHYPVDWQGKTLESKPVFAWYNAVAREVHRVKPALPIASPAFNTLEEVIRYQKNPRSEKPWVRWATTRTHEMFAWANANELISAVDLHPYVTSASYMQAALTFARRQTHKAMIATEWGQNSVLHAWINEPLNRQFSVQWKLPHQQTNAAYVKACKVKPVQLEQWNDFVDTAPLDHNFIPESYEAMRRNKVIMSAYFSYAQYPMVRPMGLLTPLYASCTVVRRNGRFQPNSHFLRSYIATANRAAGLQA